MGKILDFDSVPDTLTKNISSPELPVSGDSRYLTRLRVFGNKKYLSQSVSAQPIITSDFELGDDNTKKITQHKILAALKQLTFREQHVIVQFWSVLVIGKHQVLTTMDQSFGLGEIGEQLISYRKESECNLYLLVNDLEEEELCPPARVFKRRQPEWTPDVANYLPIQFPQKESAIRSNLHGYLALPVVDLFTSSCVGVLEILTSSKYISYAYEIQQVQSALKTTNLITTQAFDGPTIHVHDAHGQNELEKIHNVLKLVCHTHRLPLAQTWATSPPTTFASHDQILKKSCSSFHTRCLGKVCMSTAALPYYVQDLRLWSFREACKEQHLDKSCGFVGRALLSHGSCFCEDVTKLSQEEYPLVHYALMSGLSSCFAIFLHSIESNNDYVLEFFLPLHREDGSYVQNLLHTLKLIIKIASGFELGDSIEVVGPPTNLSSNIEPDNIQTSSYLIETNPQTTIISSITTTKTKILETVSSDSELIVADVAKTNSTHVVNQLSPTFLNNNGGSIPSTEIVVHDHVIRDNDNTTSNRDMVMQITTETIADAGEKSNRKRGRKRKIDSLTMETVKKHVGKPLNAVAAMLAVSPSTLRRFCRDNNMASWPLPKHNKKTARTYSNLSQTSRSKQNLQQSSNVRFGLFSFVIILVRVKKWSCAWSCASKRQGFSGNWWSCGKHSHLSFKSDSIYQVARLMVLLKRWKNKSTRHAMQKRDHLESTGKPLNELNVDRKLPNSNFFCASREQFMSNVVSDIRKVTVKVMLERDLSWLEDLGLSDLDSPELDSSEQELDPLSGLPIPELDFHLQDLDFKDDMIKFEIPITSSLFELQNEVAHRTNLKSAGFRLKYKDEDGDLKLLACDADLQNLLGRYSTSNNTTVKLIIQSDE